MGEEFCPHCEHPEVDHDLWTAQQILRRDGAKLTVKGAFFWHCTKCICEWWSSTGDFRTSNNSVDLLGEEKKLAQTTGEPVSHEARRHYYRGLYAKQDLTMDEIMVLINASYRQERREEWAKKTFWQKLGTGLWGFICLLFRGHD